jgi:hypothetical protein
MNCHFLIHFFGATHDFFGLIMAIIKVFLCLTCSQNNTLQVFYFTNNQIGDAGAASIGGALEYVTITPCE